MPPKEETMALAAEQQELVRLLLDSDAEIPSEFDAAGIDATRKVLAKKRSQECGKSHTPTRSERVRLHLRSLLGRR